MSEFLTGFGGMHEQAQLAFKAVRGRKLWGKFSAFRFAQKHGIVKLYVLIQQLNAIEEESINLS